MALVCARCGTQNPDTNRFCQACGTPLAAAAPPPAVPVGATAASPFTQAPPPAATYPGPPAGVPPGPAAYASPYYSPATGAGQQPNVHRTPWVLIVAVIVALVVVMGGVGTVLALTLGNHNSSSPGFGAVPSPTPAVSPKPGQSPSPSGQPTQPASGSTVSNDGVTVTIPTGWTVLSKDAETITLESPNGDGAITIGSGSSSPPASAQQNKDDIDKYFQQQYPDTKACPGSKVTTGSLDGAAGIYWEICFTLTSGAQSVQVGAPLFVGANAGGSVYYAVFLETEVSNLTTFIAEAKPFLNGGIKWNLK